MSECCMGLDWLGLAWLGLAWIGLDWIGLDWIGLDGEASYILKFTKLVVKSLVA